MMLEIYWSDWGRRSLKVAERRKVISPAAASAAVSSIGNETRVKYHSRFPPPPPPLCHRISIFLLLLLLLLLFHFPEAIRNMGWHAIMWNWLFSSPHRSSFKIWGALKLDFRIGDAIKASHNYSIRCSITFDGGGGRWVYGMVYT